MDPLVEYPIHVPPEFLFAPANGIQYTREDVCRVLAQQPFKGPSLPFKYLLPSPNTTSLRPPTLRYGWRFGHDKIMEIALKHFPDEVEYRFAPSTEGLDDDDDEQYSPEDYFKESKPNISETLYSLELPYAIRKYLGLPDSAPDLIKIQLLRDSEGHSEWGLTVGSNYDGILKRVYLDKLDSVLETDEPPMWYLDTLDWRWYRVPPKKVKAKTAAKPQGKAKVVAAGQTGSAKSPDKAKSVDKAKGVNKAKSTAKTKGAIKAKSVEKKEEAKSAEKEENVS